MMLLANATQITPAEIDNFMSRLLKRSARRKQEFFHAAKSDAVPHRFHGLQRTQFTGRYAHDSRPFKGQTISRS